MTTGRMAHEEQSVGAKQTRLNSEVLRPTNTVGDRVHIFRVVRRLHEDIAPRIDSPLENQANHTYESNYLNACRFR